jgi:hypothetical protein
MARDNKGFVCHRHTTMVSYELHHVWPLGYHGPDTAANKIKICPNAHSDIHYLMDRLLAGKPVDLIEYGREVRRWALFGYHQVVNYIENELLPSRAVIKDRLKNER